jgi:short-subunit dehydrogenase
MLFGISRTESPPDAAKLLSRTAPQYHHLGIDLEGGSRSAEKIGKWVASKTNYLDCVVLSAGFFEEGAIAGFSVESMRRNLDVNFEVNIYLSQVLVPFLRRGSSPRLVIIGSTAAYESYPLVPTYGVAKWALRGLAINLRTELAKDRVGVSFVSPGGTFTDMWEGSGVPASRLLQPQDLGKLVRCIVSLSEQAVVDELIVRPIEGDIHE